MLNRIYQIQYADGTVTFDVFKKYWNCEHPGDIIMIYYMHSIYQKLQLSCLCRYKHMYIAINRLMVSSSP